MWPPADTDRARHRARVGSCGLSAGELTRGDYVDENTLSARRRPTFGTSSGVRGGGRWADEAQRDPSSPTGRTEARSSWCSTCTSAAAAPRVRGGSPSRGWAGTRTTHSPRSTSPTSATSRTWPHARVDDLVAELCAARADTLHSSAGTTSETLVREVHRHAYREGLARW